MNHIACIGLGNPGPQFILTRHNIGFLILDALAERFETSFTQQHNYQIATTTINKLKVSFVKPQTFMNTSGAVLPFLIKKGIDKAYTLVVHDELELNFGIIKSKYGGSAKGHNGLRSIMEYIGPDFERLRFGIGRPLQKTDVGDYVLKPFSNTQQEQLTEFINQAVDQIVARLEVLSEGT